MADVGASPQQMRGAGVPQAVRRALEACRPQVALDLDVERALLQAGAEVREEERRYTPVRIEESVPPSPKRVVLPKKKIGSRIRALREQRGLSQSQLARSVDTAPQSMWQIETGVRGITVQQLIACFGARSPRPWPTSTIVPRDHARSKRSRFITLFQAATKSRTNFSCASAPA